MRNTLITIFGTVMVPTIVHFFVPYLVLRSTSDPSLPRLGPVELVSVALAVIGISMVVWVAVTFVWRGKGTALPLLPPEIFVAHGLYRYVRNPMYLGILLVVLAEAIYFRSAWLILYATVLWLGIHSFLVLIEEPQLERRFGHAYKEYLEVTPRWIPRFPRSRGDQ